MFTSRRLYANGENELKFAGEDALSESYWSSVFLQAEGNSYFQIFY